MSASYTFTVGDTPLRVVQLPTGVPVTTVYITNAGATEDIFVGGPTVTENSGYLITKQLASGVSYRAEFELFAGQELYACARAGKTATIHVGYSA